MLVYRFVTIELLLIELFELSSQRGMGEGAKGTSLSLVAPAEDKAHSKIAEAANVTFAKVLLDGRLLTASQERTNLASKILEAAEMENKANSRNRWFLEKAKEAELDLDDDIIEDESQWSEKEQQQLREAQKAKVRLAQLLAEPMKTQRFGKFLSTNSAALQAEIQPLNEKK
jgi:ATP-dependent RNA helicase DDX24/MAK5